MNISIVIVCGYRDSSELENDRMLKFSKCLKTLNKVKFSGNDNVIISEYGKGSKLKSLVNSVLTIPHEYIFTQSNDDVFNQSIAKNRGSEISNNELLLYINSDILLQSNALDVVRSEFEKYGEDTFCYCARTDVFLDNSEIDYFIEEINDEKNYVMSDKILLQDTGWYYCLKMSPKETPIYYKAKVFRNDKFNQKIIYDFLGGYVVFGDFIAISKNTWSKVKFDENCFSLTDVYLRDMLFDDFKSRHLSTVAEQTACFHLSGKDYAGQTKEGDPKRERLHNDQLYLAEKYERLRPYLIFGFHKEFVSLIAKYYTNEQVKEMIEKYRCSLYWKYFTDRAEFCKQYNVSEEI